MTDAMKVDWTKVARAVDKLEAGRLLLEELFPENLDEFRGLQDALKTNLPALRELEERLRHG